MIHSSLELSAVNLSVYLDLVANSLLTEILLKRNSEFRRFRPIWRPRFRRRFFQKIDEIMVILSKNLGISVPTFVHELKSTAVCASY